MSQRRLAAAALALLLCACAAVPLNAPPTPMFDASGEPLPAAELRARLATARFVLLGEVHDNAAQHAARADLLRALLADGRPTRVVFEQIDREHNGAIAALPEPRTVEAVVGAGQFDKRGWAWPLHQPLFEAALAAGAQIAGGNLSRADANRVVRGGSASLPADLRHWFDTSRPEAAWSPAQDEALRRDVDEGHCKALPATMLAPMALAQRARDAALAEALLAAPAASRVVLIAGNGHVRGDLGVPHYLRAAGVPASAITSIGYIEQTDSRSAPPAAERAAYDFTATSPPATREDPCATFKPKPDAPRPAP